MGHIYILVNPLPYEATSTSDSSPSDLRARRCSWVWQVVRGCGSSCWPARCCTWASPPGGESRPGAGAGNQAAWLCLRWPPRSQTEPSWRRWGTAGQTQSAERKREFNHRRGTSAHKHNVTLWAGEINYNQQIIFFKLKMLLQLIKINVEQ